MASIKGIDISHWQDNPDFARVKAAGVQYVIIKATEGVDYVDPCFTTNIKEAQAAGLPVGVYHLLRATPIDRQAADFLAAIKPYKITWPAAVDVEHAELTALGRDKLTDMVLDICARVKAAGYPPMVYSNRNWYYLAKLLDIDRIRAAGIPVWLAWYSDATPENTDRSDLCDIWQYASDGQIDGIIGHPVDLDVSYRDFGTGVKPVSDPKPTQIDAYYRVRTGGRWLPEVRSLTDYAGLPGSPITDAAVRVTAGSVKYRVHVKDGGWLPYVTGCDINDGANGYAGNGRPIDAVEVYYYTPSSIRPARRAKYRVSPVGGNYWPWQHDSETTGGQDGYAGSFGREIDRLQIAIE